MKIFLGADHRGFALKEAVKTWLKQQGIDFKDMGNLKLEAEDDFPDFAAKVAKKVSAGLGWGVLACGSGGMALVANKFPGVRAVEVWNKETAKHAKEHDNANILMLSADFVSKKEAVELIDIWLKTAVVTDEKHQRRLNKIIKIERSLYGKNSD